ncbi:MAG: glycerol-3-phosphate 1-O-acyltransferase PlsY [Elusimicrobia bacterium]|nr:glycerol-3-phosphate 1-O-acyltransferase PlsY [Elusimicrobiota bacterium]
MLHWKILIILFSYLLGSIPTGYLIGRMKGIDIRKCGSGNPGTANVYRTLGKWPGIITFFIDFLKGFFPAFAAVKFFPQDYLFIILVAAAGIAGHIWTIFLNFKGGKGVATSAGVFMAFLPAPTALAFAVFAVAVWITKHISVGSMSAAITLPVFCIIFKSPVPFSILAFCVCALIIYTHIPNIKRIYSGKELTFHHKK